MDRIHWFIEKLLTNIDKIFTFHVTDAFIYFDIWLCHVHEKVADACFMN